MSEYNFEEFKESGGRFKQIISLGEKSGFGLSAGFTHANSKDLVGVTGVKMFYDQEKKAIAFKFVKTKEEGVVSAKLRDKGGYIGAQSFIGKYKIDQKKYAGRYLPKEVMDDSLGKIYVIELKENGKQN